VTKHRLELFSDGVFAIVLTLLVLDLHAPVARGLAGLVEIVPALLVHAASFLVVASLWMGHHGVLARVTAISSRTLRLNLVCLFWITLIPFGARNAAESPLDPLGASLIAAATGFGLLSMLWMRLSAHSTIDDNPRLRSFRRRQLTRVTALCLVAIGSAALAWVTPWPAYAATLVIAVFLIAQPSPAEVEARDAEPPDGTTGEEKSA
jgi:uncharacterized membrane protein